jgi:septal ring factor EnvC (AmiA/AmiB activator)
LPPCNTQSQINRTENKIDQHRDAIGESLQTIYESSNENLLTILLSNSEFSDFFGKLNDLQLVQENLRVSLQNITKLRQELLDQKEELSLEKQDAENLRAIQDSQKKTRFNYFLCSIGLSLLLLFY